MKSRMLMMFALAVSTGCVTADSKNLTKSEAQQLVERGEADDDVCSEAGFNDDGVCDDWCPDGDSADCAVSDACEDGDTKDAGDGCNTCICGDGMWSCTELDCSTCEDGDMKDADDGCNTCICGDGMWSCTELDCSTNNTNNPKSPPALEVGDCPTDGDRIDVTSVSVSGDRLDIDAGFSGGCAEHTVTACWDGSFMESFPVQARITLFHDANGDMCEAYLTDTYSFDLTPMKDAYLMGYQATEGTIILGVEGESTTYDF